MAAFGAAGAGAALSPLLSGFGSSMLLNSLLSNPAASSPFMLPNLTGQPSIASNAASSSSSASINESSSQQPTAAPPGMLPFAAAAAAAGAAASFSDPQVLSQYSAALSALPSSPSTASSLFNLLSSSAANNRNSIQDGANAGTLGRALLGEMGRENIGDKGTSADLLVNDITSKTSSIADLRMKAKKHQEAMGIEERN